MQVRATDTGKVPNDATSDITVHLDDKNKFPVFEPGIRNFKFKETVENEVITTVSAFSPRINKESEITYHITGGDYKNTFEVDENSGEVRINSGLDYEMYQEYLLWIEARDNGSPSLSSILRLNIQVKDMNDNAPVFDLSFYNVSIMEEQFPPQDLLEIHALDVDMGLNGKVWCLLFTYFYLLSFAKI